MPVCTDVCVSKRVNRDTRRRCIDSLDTACGKATATTTNGAALSSHVAASCVTAVSRYACQTVAGSLRLVCMAGQLLINVCGRVGKRVNVALDT